MITSKFDRQTQNKWIDAAPTDTLATLSDLSTFINNRCLKLTSQSQCSSSSLSKPSQSKSPSQFTQKPKTSHSFHTTKSKDLSCTHCKTSGHSVLRCSAFKKLSIQDRRNAVQKLELCFNCLQHGHVLTNCPSTETCRVCQRKHHTLLHVDAQAFPKSLSPPATATSSSTSPDSSSFVQVASSLTKVALPVQRKLSYVFLATALVELYDKFGSPVIARALLDSGSQVNFITESLAKKIGSDVSESSECVSGIGSTKLSPTLATNIVFKSLINEYSRNVDCLVLSNITGYQPSHRIDITEFHIPDNIQLADPQFFCPNKIDLLLGAQLYFELLVVGQIKLAPNLPILQKTQLG